MKKLSIGLCLLFAMSAAGCWGTPLDRTGIIKGIAVDTAQSGWKVTACIMESDGYLTLEGEGQSVEEALGSISTKLSRTPFMGQNDVVIIGREAAEKGFEDVMKYFFAADARHGTEQIFICDAEGADALKINPNFEHTPPAALSQMADNAHKSSPYARASVKSVYHGMHGIERTALAPILRVEEKENEFSAYIDGMAVLSDFKIIGELNEDESEGVRWLTRDMEGYTATLATQEISAARFLSSGCDISVKDGPEFDFIINFSFASKAKDDVLKAAEERAVKCAYLAIEKARELKADFLNLSAMYLNTNKNAREQYKDNWGEAVATAKYSVKARGLLKVDVGGGGL